MENCRSVVRSGWAPATDEVLDTEKFVIENAAEAGDAITSTAATASRRPGSRPERDLLRMFMASTLSARCGSTER